MRVGRTRSRAGRGDEALPLQRLRRLGRRSRSSACRRPGCPRASWPAAPASHAGPRAGGCRAAAAAAAAAAVLLLVFGAAADAMHGDRAAGRAPRRAAAAARDLAGGGARGAGRRCEHPRSDAHRHGRWPGSVGGDRRELHLIGMLLALAAAVALNASYLMQHAGSSAAAAIDPRRPVAHARPRCCARPAGRSARSSALTGWALHIGAMREAPLSLVQAFVAGGLALTVPMAAIGLRPAPRARRDAGARADGARAGAAVDRAAGGGRHASFGARAGAWLAALALLARGRAAGASRRPRAAPLALGARRRAAVRRRGPGAEGRHRAARPRRRRWRRRGCCAGARLHRRRVLRVPARPAVRPRRCR